MADELTALDATFLELEEVDQGAHMHIGGVMVFEPSPEGRAPNLDEITRHLEERLGTMPRYRQRLSSPITGGLHWPSWEEDPHFELSGHLRRAALPAPGGEEELAAWAGEFFSERLDRSRPLWEMVVIEGLAGGRWALATKTHHCMVDGVGSVDVVNLMLDAEPTHSPTQAPPPKTTAPGPAPDRPGAGGPLSLPMRTLGGMARLPLRAAKAGADLAGRGVHVVRHPGGAADAAGRARAMAEVLLRDEVNSAPRTSLNVAIGGKRRLAFTSVPLADLKRIKAALGGTINDAVLAITAGGLRRLLLNRGDPLPEQGLRAMVPMNVRAAGEHLALGNKVSSLFVHLPVAVGDPLERYRAQVAEAEGLKSGRQAIGSTALVDLTSHAPPVVHSFLARSLFATRLFNVTITNVPGPQQALYAFGSRMLDVWPLVPLASEHAVALAVFSYDGRLFFCLNADLDTMPDLEVLAEGIEESVAELRTAARERAVQPSH